MDAIPPMRIDVVEENAHAHAAVGSLNDFIRQQPAGQIAVPDVVHQIEAASRAARRKPARGEGVEIRRKHGKAAFSRRARGKFRRAAVERGLPIDGRQGERRFAPRPLGEAPV